MTPTAAKADFPENNYALSDYEPKVKGIYANRVGNSVPAHLTASKEWFGLS